MADITKREYSAIDANPVVLYAKKDGSKTEAFPLRADPSTASIQTIAYEHHEVHSGSHYLYNDVYTLSINNVADIRITTPNTTKWTHFLVGFDTSSEFEFWLYENVTITVTGSTITPINNNRNSSNTSGMALDGIQVASLALANAATNITGSTQILHGKLGAGRTEGGMSSRDNEIILKQNTTYVFRALAVAAGYIHGEFSWYEHTDAT